MSALQTPYAFKQVEISVAQPIKA